jgi:YkoY family integral membrane protein
MWGIDPADLPTILLAIASLVVLEGLLSADNALVLAVMVRHLPDKVQQKRALRYGIWGAFVFRLIAVLTANYLLQFWELKVIGGAYLLFLALRHLLYSETEQDSTQGSRRSPAGFWTTVFNVEMADIAFSIDSILAAVAMVRGLPEHLQENKQLTLGIVYLGGVLGIVTMRYVAGFFLVLLDRFKGLAAGAYYLVAWIGLKLIGGGLHDAFDTEHHALDEGWRSSIPDFIKTLPWEMNDLLFWGGMVLIIGFSLMYRPRERSQVARNASETTSPVTAGPADLETES